MSAGVPFAARRKYATVVELADTPDLESGAVKSLSVQIRSVAPCTGQLRLPFFCAPRHAYDKNVRAYAAIIHICTR